MHKDTVINSNMLSVASALEHNTLVCHLHVECNDCCRGITEWRDRCQLIVVKPPVNQTIGESSGYLWLHAVYITNQKANILTKSMF